MCWPATALARLVEIGIRVSEVGCLKLDPLVSAPLCALMACACIRSLSTPEEMCLSRLAVSTSPRLQQNMPIDICYHTGPRDDSDQIHIYLTVQRRQGHETELHAGSQCSCAPALQHQQQRVSQMGRHRTRQRGVDGASHVPSRPPPTRIQGGTRGMRLRLPCRLGALL